MGLGPKYTFCWLGVPKIIQIFSENLKYAQNQNFDIFGQKIRQFELFEV